MPEDTSIETSEREARAPVADHELPNRGPRVTPASIDDEIASEHFFTAAQGAQLPPIEGVDYIPPRAVNPLDLLTLCVLVLKNGFTVTGESACASPENFDADVGRRIARENAVRKVWPLLGFRMRDELAVDEMDCRDRAV